MGVCRMIVINFDKAKQITKERLRQERKPLLEQQDILFQRSLENNSDTSAIIVEKQRLRDITDLVDNASTIEQLKQLTINN
jgi:UDP-N-acetylglucosamine pyrophosphorylase